jgi:hypothetical protein
MVGAFVVVEHANGVQRELIFLLSEANQHLLFESQNPPRFSCKKIDGFNVSLCVFKLLFPIKGILRQI